MNQSFSHLQPKESQHTFLNPTVCSILGLEVNVERKSNSYIYLVETQELETVTLIVVPETSLKFRSLLSQSYGLFFGFGGFFLPQNATLNQGVFSYVDALFLQPEHKHLAEGAVS